MGFKEGWSGLFGGKSPNKTPPQASVQERPLTPEEKAAALQAQAMQDKAERESLEFQAREKGTSEEARNVAAARILAKVDARKNLKDELEKDSTSLTEKNKELGNKKLLEKHIVFGLSALRNKDAREAAIIASTAHLLEITPEELKHLKKEDGLSDMIKAFEESGKKMTEAYEKELVAQGLKLREEIQNLENEIGQLNSSMEVLRASIGNIDLELKEI
jgi:ribonuclease HII